MDGILVHVTDEYHTYDPETGILTWDPRGCEPSPVPGVSIEVYEEIVAAIERNAALSTSTIFAINAKYVEPWLRKKREAERACATRPRPGVVP